MIIDCKGSIFDSGAQALVNPVNCFGVMGAGLALEFRKRFPDYYDSYIQDCNLGEVAIGHVSVYESIYWPCAIISFPTKTRWEYKSSITYILYGLRDLSLAVSEFKFGSIAIPALGCGLGGLKWENVRPLIVKEFEALPKVSVLLYGPGEPSGGK